MYKTASKTTVLARIPDLTASETNVCDEKEPTARFSALGGRILDQSLSFKLLSGLAVLLVAASIWPFFSAGKKPAADTAAEDDQFSQRQTDTPTAPAELRVARRPSVRPATLVPATPEEAAAPEIITLPGDAKRQSPSSAVPLMSVWPRGAESDDSPPAARADGQPSGGARPMAVPPDEYRAETGPDNAKQGAGGKPREDTNDQPADGKRYDNTRSGVY